MTETRTAVAMKPLWVDLSSSDPTASRTFYSRLFGWNIEVSADPQYGGYALAKIGGKDAAGIGATQTPEAPTAWMIYVGTDDADDLSNKVKAAGGSVVAAPFAVADLGRMAVYQDPTGAFIAAWEPKTMGGFDTNTPNTFGWAELNARGIGRAVSFYREVFGWMPKTSEPVEGQPPYTEFELNGERIAGAMEMNPMVPANVPSYWMAYFNVEDVDSSFRKAIESGGQEMMAPQEFPGGRFAILSDPQGATFGLLKMAER